MGADGQNQVQLTSNSTNDDEPAWSPDGRRIAFRRSGPGFNDIFVMDADGQNQVQLTNAPGSDSEPAWSPDGQLIAFRSNRDADSEIYVMGADGQNQTRLTFDPASDGEPTFSPDGQRIAFQSNRPEPPGTDQEIVVMDTDGQNQVPLTNNSFGDFEPTFSPDGRRIAFSSDREADFEIFVMDADGQNQAPLTTDPASDFEPNWQPLNPPAFDLTGASKQKSAKFVTVTVTAQTEDVAVSLAGMVRVPKVKQGARASKAKTFQLAPLSMELQPGQPTTVELAVPRKARKLLKRAFESGKKGTATVTGTATDDLGAATQDGQQVKLKKRKPKK
jgi:dipeptidyl aminopeptidase/acylaminoacyl peptidase